MSKKKEKGQNEAASEPANGQAEAPQAEAPEIETSETDGQAAAQPEADPLEEQLKAEKDKYLRLAAEYDNFRKRSAKEREAIFADVRADTVVKFLPVYDNLSRALKQETADEAYKKGVEMTMSGLREILSKLGVEEIPALGETFDPSLHNAVMHVEDENVGENTVVDVFQTGFKLGDKVIRFAMVKVAN